MKFPSALGDIVIVYVDQKVAREYYVASLKVEPTNRLRYKESPRGQSKEHNKRRYQGPKGCLKIGLMKLNLLEKSIWLYWSTLSLAWMRLALNRAKIFVRYPYEMKNMHHI